MVYLFIFKNIYYDLTPRNKLDTRLYCCFYDCTVGCCKISIYVTCYREYMYMGITAKISKNYKQQCKQICLYRMITVHCLYHYLCTNVCIQIESRCNVIINELPLLTNYYIDRWNTSQEIQSARTNTATNDRKGYSYFRRLETFIMCKYDILLEFSLIFA